VKNPNEPATWVPRLSDPAQRANAVNRLAAIYEATLQRDEGKRDGPNAKPVADAAAGPLNDLCKSDNLAADVRKNLVRLLASMRDRRGAPCLVGALSAYEPGRTEDEVGAAAKALGAMGWREAAGPLFEVFVKLQYSTEPGKRIEKDLHDAMVALVDPAWEGRLVALLGTPVALGDIQRRRDELYWQSTAAELLGILRSEKAIEPLLRVMLSPMKADMQSTALHALIRIGKPVVELASALLRGDSKALVAYAQEEFQRAPRGLSLNGHPALHMEPAALVLGSIGREECAAPLLDALPKADPLVRTIIARELVKVPQTPQTMKAFRKAFEATPIDSTIPLTIPPSKRAREVMLEGASYLFDASLVPWIVQTALAARGDEKYLETNRTAAFSTAMMLMTRKQIAAVEKLSATKVHDLDRNPVELGKLYQIEWTSTKEVLASCNDDVECWLGELTKSGSQAARWRSIKAAYMLGVLGRPEIRTRLVDAMPKIGNAAVVYVTARAVDRLSPKGDPVLADRLEALVREAEQSKDQHRIAQRSFLKEIVYRLRARAQ
jgi:HEAT repeat protein